LVYYEAYAPSQASDWQSRLAGTSQLATLVGFIALSGLLNALPAVSGAGSSRGAIKTIKPYIDDIASSIKDGLRWIANAVQGAADTVVPNTIASRVSTFTTAVRGWIDEFATGIKMRLPPNSVYIKAGRQKIKNLNMRVAASTATRMSLDAAVDGVHNFARPALKSDVVKYIVTGRTAQGEVTEGIISWYRSRGGANVDLIYGRLRQMIDELPENHPVRVALEDLSDDQLRGIARAIRKADRLTHPSKDLSIGPTLLSKLSGMAGAGMSKAIRFARGGRVRRFFADKIAGGYRALKYADEPLRKKLIKRAEGMICGSYSVKLALAESAIQDAVAYHTTQQNLQARYAAGAIEPIYLGTTQVVGALSTACGNGRSVLGALAGV
ncbi:MAG: hypothetical protein ABEI52_05955, partial [Halobacteriaceae archaeon]